MAQNRERETLAGVRDRWRARAVALAAERRDARRLNRMLANDPGGRLAQRAAEITACLALAERVARAELALAERNLTDDGCA